MELASHAVAVQFVSDAFVHLKAIGATDSVGALLDAARVKPDEGIVDFDLFIEAATRRYYDRESVVGPQL
jgi:catalase